MADLTKHETLRLLQLSSYEKFVEGRSSSRAGLPISAEAILISSCVDKRDKMGFLRSSICLVKVRESGVWQIIPVRIKVRPERTSNGVEGRDSGGDLIKIWQVDLAFSMPEILVPSDLRQDLRSNGGVKPTKRSSVDPGPYLNSKRRGKRKLSVVESSHLSADTIMDGMVGPTTNVMLEEYKKAMLQPA